MNPSTSFRTRHWKVLGKKVTGHNLIKSLLQNRGFKNKKDIEEFFNPDLSNVTIKNVAIDNQQLKKAVNGIQKAIKNKEQIVVYGDYDVDGICGTAILWETLRDLKASALPYIPHRIDEGYGLSIKGIENIRSQIAKTRLIITVDNGIVANEAVDFANDNGIDVIITDHHVKGKKLPKAYAIVHTIKLCGAGVAWMLVQEVKSQISLRPEFIPRVHSEELRARANLKTNNNHLELVVLATIADLVPLLGANRTLVRYGLESLRQTQRIGLLELLREAGIDSQNINTYEVGHILAPRLNAMGRIEHALDSLRILCTKDIARARSLAQKLATTNKERQQITEETVMHAKLEVTSKKLEVGKLLFVAHESYQQGVIGLVAGKLVEEFYRPAIVVSKGEKYSKASARSVSGFNIIEFIRSASELLVDAGGHPMAAGFTVETEKLFILREKLVGLADKLISGDKLVRTLRIDCEINLPDVTHGLYDRLAQFAPFGMGNPEPTFITKNVVISDMWLVGNDGRHLKLKLSTFNSQLSIEGIAFGMGERAGELHTGDTIDIVYTIEQDEWLAQRSPSGVGNGDKKLQLKIKDFKINSLSHS